MSEFDRKKVEAAIGRRAGMDPQKAAELTQTLSQKTDWYIYCPDCDQKIEGSLAKVQEGCDCAQPST